MSIPAAERRAASVAENDGSIAAVAPTAADSATQAPLPDEPVAAAVEAGRPGAQKAEGQNDF